MKYKQQGYVSIILAALLAGSVIVAGWWIYQRHKTNNSWHTSFSLNSVPAEFRVRAQQQGEYCPSWAAKAGEVVSDICYPVSGPMGL